MFSRRSPTRRERPARSRLAGSIRDLAGLGYQGIATWVVSAFNAPSQVLDLINSFGQRLPHVIRLTSTKLFRAAGIISPAYHGNENESFGSLSAKASDRIANLSRSGIRNVAKADKGLRNRLVRLAGSGDLQRTTAAMDDAGQRLSRLFLTQLALNAGFGLVIGTGLWFIGVPSAPLWSMLAMMHEAGTTNRPIPQSAQRLSGG